jgi:hypothetical protein
VTAVLLANAAATLYMVGLTWFVQVAHYPLFSSVGKAEFVAYHRRHSDRTTLVVLPPMLVELITSILLLFDPPAGERGMVIAGAALAVGTWLLTAAASAIHGRIGEAGLLPALDRRLAGVSWARTVVWTAHGVVVVALLGAAIDGGM